MTSAARMLVNHDEQQALDACLAGVAAQNAGRHSDAIGHFSRAVSYAPANLDLRFMLAFAQAAGGAGLDASITLADTPGLATLSAVDARRVADAATTLGANLVAQTAVQRAMHFAPDDADLHATLGALHHRLGDTAQASLVLHRAHVRWPKHVPTLMNRARLLADSGEYAEGLALYDEVVRLQPSHASARWYRGMLRLLLGDVKGGWADHEARRELPMMRSRMPRDIPALSGNGVDGRTVLLWGEQGLGDQIMGVRFARDLEARGARVVVRCAPSLVTLFECVSGVSAVIPDETGSTVSLASQRVLRECDVHVPMLSVPALLSFDTEEAYGGGQYVSTAKSVSQDVRDLVAGWSSASPSRRPARVAVVWAGSVNHANDLNRSFPAALLPQLLSADVEWVSLQMGDRKRDLDALDPSLRGRVVDAGALVSNFNDSAHVLSHCDLLVTVDTSAAHLAGALGVPTVVMLPYVPDWRWQATRRDTPWYRSVQLVRQPMAGAWEHVVKDVQRVINSHGY